MLDAIDKVLDAFYALDMLVIGEYTFTQLQYSAWKELQAQMMKLSELVAPNEQD